MKNKFRKNLAITGTSFIILTNVLSYYNTKNIINTEEYSNLKEIEQEFKNSGKNLEGIFLGENDPWYFEKGIKTVKNLQNGIHYLTIPGRYTAYLNDIKTQKFK